MRYRIVKCPKCGKYRKTSSIKNVKCFFCGHIFNARSHIVSEKTYKNAVNKEVKFR